MRYAINPLKLLTPLLVVICCANSVAVAEEENYYLEQMRKQSQSDNNAPKQGLPENDSSLIAETDLKELTKASDEDLSNINDIEPNLEKPKLEVFKPEL